VLETEGWVFAVLAAVVMMDDVAAVGQVAPVFQA